MEDRKSASRFRKLGLSLKARWQLLAMVVIPLAYIIVFHYIPMLGIQIAFKKYDFRKGIWGSPWVGLYQFERLIKSYQFTRIITNTLRLSLYGLLAGFPVPIIFALMLNAMPYMRYKKAVQTITYMPHFISTIVMVGILMQIFNIRIGIYGILGKLFTGSAPPDLFAMPNAFPHMYVWSGIWQGLGWNSIIYIAALAGIDPELYEAAIIDGASRFQRLVYIDLPGITSTISILLIMSVGRILGVGFEKVYLMQNNLNLKTSEVISTYVYKVGLVTGGGDFSFGTAVGLMNSVVSFVMIYLVNKICRRLGGASLW